MRDENALPLSLRHEVKEKKTPKSLFYIGFEGNKTELRYFNKLVACQKYLGISSVIEIHPLTRQNEARDLSHPRYCIPLFVEALHEYASGKMKVRSAADHFIEWLHEKRYIGGKHSVSLQKKQKTKLLQILKEGGYDASDYIDDTSKIAEFLCNNAERFCSSVLREDKIREFSDRIQKQTRTFDKDYDSACFLMDRDELSVSTSDFDAAFSLCSQEKISLYVSNPRFELWLLLHFLSRDDMKIEDIENPHSKYLEKCLDTELKKLGVHSGYSKSSYDAGKFMDKNRILQAVKNESEFCEERSRLRDEPGCNIGLIMKDLICTKNEN